MNCAYSDNVGGLAGDLMFIQDCALQTRQSVCEFFQEYRNLSVISWSPHFQSYPFRLLMYAQVV